MPRRSTPHPLATGIGARIAQLRREQGLTAEKLAYESDVGSKGYVSDIEHGFALPSLTTLDCIAQRLGVALYDLLVFPAAGDRERLIDRTRHLPKGPLSRLLRDLEEAQVSAPWVAPRSNRVRAYSTLEVAAGWAAEALPRAELESDMVRLPGKFQRADFAVRASGHSMVGFRSTIRDGDWLVMRRMALTPEAALGQVVLVAREDTFGDRSLHVKRVSKKGRRVLLCSDDRDVKPLAATEHDAILASLVTVVTPESMAPAPHTRFPKQRVSAIFGISREPMGPWARVDGHLFFQLEIESIKRRALLPISGCAPRPAETAYVVALDGNFVEYAGLARYAVQRDGWRLDEPSKVK